MILFKTVLGKGVSFMENNPDWHGSPPNQKDRDAAMAGRCAEGRDGGPGVGRAGGGRRGER